MSWLGMSRGQKLVSAQVQSYLGKKEKEEKWQIGRGGRELEEKGKGREKMGGKDKRGKD